MLVQVPYISSMESKGYHRNRPYICGYMLYDKSSLGEQWEIVHSTNLIGANEKPYGKKRI